MEGTDAIRHVMQTGIIIITVGDLFLFNLSIYLFIFEKMIQS